ncbi:hypothetical protein ACFSQJ_05680 [Croceitalea marina]|uniref:Cardiolipin synthase N-terminal domain-containing protein n=1 Tax=Croceitalea marina TaxID=1775166 RepID=A0ABW5MUL7_9FLAO
MKKSALVFAVLTWVFTILCYYFMFYADAGPDGLGTFFTIIIIGVFGLVCFVIFCLLIWFKNDQATFYKLLFTTIIALPIIIILIRVFNPQTIDAQEIETIEVLE